MIEPPYAIGLIILVTSLQALSFVTKGPGSPLASHLLTPKAMGIDQLEGFDANGDPGPAQGGVMTANLCPR